MNKKIMVIVATLLTVAMMVTPVLAFGPTKAENNKNIVYQAEDQVWMWNQLTGDVMPSKPCEGVFQEWGHTITGGKFRLMRLDAARVNIGNAVDGSSLPFPPDNPGPTFGMLLTAETRWVYLNQAGYYNLMRGFGFPAGQAAMISSWFPEGVYFKADVLGN